MRVHLHNGACIQNCPVLGVTSLGCGALSTQNRRGISISSRDVHIRRVVGNKKPADFQTTIIKRVKCPPNRLRWNRIGVRLKAISRGRCTWIVFIDRAVRRQGGAVRGRWDHRLIPLNQIRQPAQLIFGFNRCARLQSSSGGVFPGDFIQLLIGKDGKPHQKQDNSHHNQQLNQRKATTTFTGHGNLSKWAKKPNDSIPAYTKHTTIHCNYTRCPVRCSCAV